MGVCSSCKKDEELRFGVCFDCATSGEAQAAKRSVCQHARKAIENIKRGQYEYAKYDLRWAWQRMTRTGDYAKGGTFDWEGYDWR